MAYLLFSGVDISVIDQVDFLELINEVNSEVYRNYKNYSRVTVEFKPAKTQPLYNDLHNTSHLLHDLEQIIQPTHAVLVQPWAQDQSDISFNEFLEDYLELRERDYIQHDARGNPAYNQKYATFARSFIYLYYLPDYPFYLNKEYDFRGRIYARGVLSPTFNKPIRDFIQVNKQSNAFLYHHAELDITSSMITLMLSSIHNQPYNQLVSLIINKQFDTHLYLLIKMNQKLKLLDLNHP